MRTNASARVRFLGLALGALVTAAAALAPATAEARTPNQAAFHDAFRRMDARWPNISSHDYWIALQDAEQRARGLSAWERESDGDVKRDLRVFQVYRNCWLALVAKERALSEFVIGQLLVRDDYRNADAAREHFALSVAAWDEAIRLWPYLVRERVKGDSPDGRGDLVGTGATWRAQATRLLESTITR